MSDRTDLIIVGGGLAGGLLAYRLKLTRPSLRVRLLESAPTLGGNHTWSFHTSDLTEDTWIWMKPFVSKSWDEYEVCFPEVKRILPTGYHSIQSEHFHKFLLSELGDSVVLGVPVKELLSGQVILQDGRVWEASTVIDARGFPDSSNVPAGYQKFVGLDLELSSPHGIRRPMLMDATIPQTDGFRFFYVLPWSETTLLIEDTYYSDTKEIDVQKVEAEIVAYSKSKNWNIQKVLRREVGSLPIPLVGESLSPRPGVPAIGVRGGFFHATTGYSLPIAVGVAEKISSLSNLNASSIEERLASLTLSRDSDEKFFRLLNRMLFRAAVPEERYKVLERFFTMSEDLIQNFFLGSMSLKDRARVLTGRPPVNILKAIRCIREGEAYV